MMKYEEAFYGPYATQTIHMKCLHFLWIQKKNVNCSNFAVCLKDRSLDVVYMIRAQLFKANDFVS